MTSYWCSAVAVSGEDYSGGEGSLVFEHGETAKMIDIPIINDLVSPSYFTLAGEMRSFAISMYVCLSVCPL